MSTADVIRRPGARAREERLSEELANPDETTGATKADAQSSAAAAATQAATTFILKLDCVVLLCEVVGSAYIARTTAPLFFLRGTVTPISIPSATRRSEPPFMFVRLALALAPS